MAAIEPLPARCKSVSSSSAIGSGRRGPALSDRSIERIRHRTLRIRHRRANCDPRAIPFLRPTKAKRRQPEPQKGDPLTTREAQILELLASGLRTAGVAAPAGVSIRTAKFHLSHALKKAGAPDRANLLLWWVREHESAQPPGLIKQQLAAARASIVHLERELQELRTSIAAAAGVEN